MLTTLLAAALAAAGAGPPPAPVPVFPVNSVDDVVALVNGGLPPATVVAAIVAAGAYLPIEPERAVRLYFDGVPAPVLAAIFASTGEEHPRVSARPGEIELLYDGFRILGRKSAGGEPTIAVSGYDRKGGRLSPPVEGPPPSRLAEAEAHGRDPVAGREGESGPPVMINLPEASAPTVSITIVQQPPVIYQESAVIYLASPYGYGPRIDAGVDLRPTVGFDWANYIPLSWPAFHSRPEWSTGVNYRASPLPSEPAPRVVRDSISR